MYIARFSERIEKNLACPGWCKTLLHAFDTCYALATVLCILSIHETDLEKGLNEIRVGIRCGVGWRTEVQKRECELGAKGSQSSSAANTRHKMGNVA